MQSRRSFQGTHFKDYDDIWHTVRTIAWRAAQDWRLNLDKQLGEQYHLPNGRKGTWKADATLWAETMIDEKANKAKTDVELPDKPEKMLKKSGDPEKNQMKCFYGHTTTSLKDRRGRPRWLVSPCNWPGIPPGRTLCQACYEANYQAARKGHVAKINEKRYPRSPTVRKKQMGRMVKTMNVHCVQKTCWRISCSAITTWPGFDCGHSATRAVTDAMASAPHVLQDSPGKEGNTNKR